MQVKRSHFKNPFAASPFEIRNLQNHAYHFADRDDSDDWQDKPLPGHQRYHCQGSSQRERAGISHEQLRRMYVEP